MKVIVVKPAMAPTVEEIGCNLRAMQKTVGGLIEEIFPWESDPDNNIISYMSPFGNAILDKKVGDSAKFVINEHSYDYTVKAINKAKDF